MSEPASGEDSPRNHFVPRFRVGRIREASYRDMAVRFAFGGTISVVAALIGAVTTESIGGIFTAFPAILVASLTLIDKQEDPEHASYDAVGAALGRSASSLARCSSPSPWSGGRSRIAWGGPFDLAGGERRALCALCPARFPGPRRGRIRRQISPRTRPRDRRIRFGSILRRSDSLLDGFFSGYHARFRIFMRYHNMLWSAPRRRRRDTGLSGALRDRFMRDPASEVRRIPLPRLYEKSG